MNDKYTELTALFCAALKGDAVKYSRFLQTVSALLRRTVCRRLPTDDAEDLLQDILISVHKARHTYDGQRPLMPWLFAIAQFRLKDHLRRLYARSQREIGDGEISPDALVDVTKPALENEYIDIDELLQQVPQRERHILMMMYADGYTAKETGKQLDMNESAVKVAAHRAIKKLRKKFKT